MQSFLRRWFILILATMTIVVAGCFPQQTPPSAADPSPIQTASPPLAQANRPQPGNLPRLAGKATVELVVKGKPITIEVNGSDAPVTAGNFVDLVQRNVYNGLAFHRVVRTPSPFVVQGGDPQSKNPAFPVEQLGTGSFIDPTTTQPRYIPLEIKPQGAKEPVYSQTFEAAGVTAPPLLKHQRGAVAMARSMYPDSASSQFYIALADTPFLDGSYAVFGYVKEGMDVVDKIQQGDRIESARVVSGADNLKPGGKS